MIVYIILLDLITSEGKKGRLYSLGLNGVRVD